MAQAQLRISGPGVTPFGPANQQLLINVLSDAAQNISTSQIRIILVSDAYTFRRRLQVTISTLCNLSDLIMPLRAVFPQFPQQMRRLLCGDPPGICFACDQGLALTLLVLRSGILTCA